MDFEADCGLLALYSVLFLVWKNTPVPFHLILFIIIWVSSTCLHYLPLSHTFIHIYLHPNISSIHISYHIIFVYSQHDKFEDGLYNVAITGLVFTGSSLHKINIKYSWEGNLLSRRKVKFRGCWYRVGGRGCGVGRGAEGEGRPVLTQSATPP